MRAIVIIFLAAIPFVSIGFALGLVVARSIYLPTLKWQRKYMGRVQRNTQFAIRHAANMGYEVGRRETT